MVPRRPPCCNYLFAGPGLFWLLNEPREPSPCPQQPEGRCPQRLQRPWDHVEEGGRGGQVVEASALSLVLAPAKCLLSH